MLERIRQLLIGSPIATQQSAQERLNKVRALAAFSPDALSSFQTIYGHPSGGGSYTVARENLGTLPGLVAAAALLTGYLFTVDAGYLPSLENLPPRHKDTKKTVSAPK